jgi:hypothetical protein
MSSYRDVTTIYPRKAAGALNWNQSTLRYYRGVDCPQEGVHLDDEDESCSVFAVARGFCGRRSEFRCVRADTFISTDNDGIFMRKAQFMADNKDLSYVPASWQNSDEQVFLYGDVAVVAGIYHAKG